MIPTASQRTIDAASAALPAFTAPLQPSPERTRLGILVALADVMGKPDVLRGDDKSAQTLFWKAYHTDLAHLPAAVLSRACAAHRRSGEKWFPTPGQLLIHARADQQWRDDAEIRKGLARLAAAKPPSERIEITPGEQAEIDRKWEALRRSIRTQEAVANAERIAEAREMLEKFSAAGRDARDEIARQALRETERKRGAAA